jgi:hypothetical protein
VDPNLGVTFGVFNYGAGYEDADRQRLEQQIQTQMALGSPDDKERDLTRTLNASTLSWHGCDGPVAAAFKVLSNEETGPALAPSTATRAANWPISTDVFQREPRPGADGCHTSRYRVRLRVVRDSNPPL